MMIDQLPAEAIDALVQAAGPGGAFPLVSVEVRHLDGEVARPRPGNGALACLDADYVLPAADMTPVPDLMAGHGTGPGDQGRPGALGGPADVPQLRRPRQPDPVQPSHPACGPLTAAP
jgi:hypothetical protein